MSRHRTAATLLLILVVSQLLHGADCSLSRLSGQWATIREQDDLFYEHPESTPAHRYSHAAVWDDVADPPRMVVVMGYFYNHRLHHPNWCGDVWSLNSKTHLWTQLHQGASKEDSGSAAPSARYGHTASFDRQSYSLVVFGGDDGQQRRTSGSTHNDVWKFDLTSNKWQQLLGDVETSDGAEYSGPAKRSLHAAGLLQRGDTSNVLVVHGGLGKSDTWLLEMESLRWTQHDQSQSPGLRHGAASVVHQNVLYLFGGAHIGPLAFYNDLWQFALDKGWTQLTRSVKSSGEDPFAILPLASGGTATIPSARSYVGAAVVSLPANAITESEFALAVVGGANCTGRCICYGDTWVWPLEATESSVDDNPSNPDVATSRWISVSTGKELSTRYHHSIVSDGNSLWTFGGESFRPIYMYHNSVSRLLLAAAAPGMTGSGAFKLQLMLLLLSACVVFVVMYWLSKKANEYDKRE